MAASLTSITTRIWILVVNTTQAYSCPHRFLQNYPQYLAVKNNSTIVAICKQLWAKFTTTTIFINILSNLTNLAFSNTFVHSTFCAISDELCASLTTTTISSWVLLQKSQCIIFTRSASFIGCSLIIACQAIRDFTSCISYSKQADCEYYAYQQRI